MVVDQIGVAEATPCFFYPEHENVLIADCC